MFTAKASGIKTKEVKFKYDWWKFSSGHNPFMVGRRLLIDNVGIGDASGYYCIVTNEWGNKKNSSRVHLIVTGKIRLATYICHCTCTDNFISCILCVHNSSTRSIHL